MRDSRGAPGPLGSAPSNFHDLGYLYKCDGCEEVSEFLEDDLKHEPCPECKTGILHLTTDKEISDMTAQSEPTTRVIGLKSEIDSAIQPQAPPCDPRPREERRGDFRQKRDQIHPLIEVCSQKLLVVVQQKGGNIVRGRAKWFRKGFIKLTEVTIQGSNRTVKAEWVLIDISSISHLHPDTVPAEES